MLISAAVCPHPPILVPELAGAADPVLESLLAACDRAVATLLRTGLVRTEDAVLIVVGGGDATRRHPFDAAGGLRPYGLDLVVGRGEPVLPLSLTIGRWLLDRAGYEPPDAGLLEFVEVASDASVEECLRLGADLAGSAERVALLVMGDGSACLTAAAPGYLDERAEPYDSGVARALRDVDPAALAALDPELSATLQVAGRAAWQVLAGAAGARETGAAGVNGAAGAAGMNGPDTFAGELLSSTAPYGVGYHVATWTRSSAVIM